MFNFKIHNFRSFQNQSFNFSRINILIGENSGGKSSLLKFLLSLKQTLESPTEVNLKLKGDYTDLGNYEEVVYYRKKDKKIRFEFEIGLDYYDYFTELILLIEDDLTKIKFNKIKKIASKFKAVKSNLVIELNSQLNDHSSIETTLSNEKIGNLVFGPKKPKDEGGLRQLACDLIFDFQGVKGIIKNCTAFKEGFLTLFDGDFRTQCEEQFPENADEIYYKIVYLLGLQNYTVRQIEKLTFVNPISSNPKRFYFQEDKKTTYRNIDIEKFINVISDKSLSKKQYNERILDLNNIIKGFGIAEEIDIIKDKILPVIALNVKTKDFWSNITDVGYGVSLQIPILFQALLSENYTKNGETILIEQPEVHLHPSLQAKFIDTLLEIGPKNNYFIETHSEHIIRMLQVIIKNKKHDIKPEDVTIHYFKRDVNQFTITNHQISPNGKLTPSFPSGFYDNSYILAKQLI